ncbi:efflux RND transporter periplasmic adaptor subunit [Arenimonas fontis]|uniref:Efflux RND transporter periplasmic adaptor subunit n=1 Tax=Arenimonas fontis TaxID=2608255 RepID=A0A5B2ZAL1_9GAMM|nr:efflux RND transporter periplasmic adaptor subunit [Arenimonas fontis]KAA2284161.1 efflux RND transporter periplasmic adaptor subunit [Arenimonas fontis]
MNRVVRFAVSFQFLLACAGVPAQAPPTQPPARVQTAAVVQAEFAPLHWAPGTVASREDARVAAEIGGRVVEIAEVGSAVRKGEPLARLDDAEFRLRERQARADLSRIQAQLDLVRKQEERYLTLVRDGVISGAQLDQVIAERRMREQDLDAARVALEQARLRLRQAQVRAPFDGIVVERLVEQGEYLALGAPVARLVNTGALEVRTRAPVTLAGRLRPGDGVTLRVAGRSSAHRLDVVVPVGDEASRQLELRFALTPDQAAKTGLAVGAAVQVGVPSDEPRRALAVPRDALVMRKEGTHVMRVAEGDVAQRVPVDTGAAAGDLVEVRGALRAGDRLVVRGSERLQSGQRVSVADGGTPAAVAATARPRP